MNWIRLVFAAHAALVLLTTRDAAALAADAAGFVLLPWALSLYGRKLANRMADAEMAARAASAHRAALQRELIELQTAPERGAPCPSAPAPASCSTTRPPPAPPTW